MVLLYTKLVEKNLPSILASYVTDFAIMCPVVCHSKYYINGSIRFRYLKFMHN